MCSAKPRAEFSAAEIVLVADPLETEGANDPWQLAQLERAFQLRAARALCVQGVRFADPARVDIRGTVTVGSDVEIDVDVVFEGDVRARRRRAHRPVLPARRTSRSPPAPKCARIATSTARAPKARCTIGPFARLRPGTVLADGVHVGNFVETKNATLGVGSKANHLSYLGDAVIGAGVNVGAGTITCNYDGVNKSTTTIEDGAFIGSNTSLVAPVTIGKDATIGAGSVITKARAGGQADDRARAPGSHRRLAAADEEAEITVTEARSDGPALQAGRSSKSKRAAPSPRTGRRPRG